MSALASAWPVATSVGSVPGKKYSCIELAGSGETSIPLASITEVGASKPVALSMVRTLTLGGGENGENDGATFGGATGSSRSRVAFIAPIQIGSAALPPLSPVIGLGVSKPTHAIATSSSVKPANQASRLSAAVPVLPATGTPSCLALVPVPSSTTDRIRLAS